MTTKAILIDLLPLYADGLLSDDTRQWVAENLPNYPDCQDELRHLKHQMKIPKTDQPLDFLKQSIKTEKYRYGRAILSACLALIIIVLTTLTMPRHLDNDGQLFTVNQTDETISVLFSKPVTHLNLTDSLDHQQQPIVLVDGYTTLWNQLFPSQEQVFLTRSSSEKLYYENHGKAVESITGKELDGGMVILPRLMLNYYAIIIGLVTVIMIVICACRKWWCKKSLTPKTLVYLSTFPLSFFASWLTITGLSGTSYYATQELSAISLLTGAYGLLLLSLYQIKINRL